MFGNVPPFYSPFPYGPIPSSGVPSTLYVDLFNAQTVAGAKTWSNAAVFSSTLAVTGLSTLTGGLVAVAAPTSISGRAIGARNSTATSAAGIVGEGVGVPASNAGNVWYGTLGKAEIASGIAFGSTSVLGLLGVAGAAQNAGSGTVTGAAALYADNVTNTGGGIITNVYGLYMSDQTAATNNYGLYQVGANVINYMQGRLGIGLTSPDATVELDLRGTSSQLALGTATKQGFVGASSGIGTHTAWRATADGATWTARATSASGHMMANSTQSWFIDAGLTDGNTFTPTTRMSLSTESGGRLWVAAAPTGYTSYQVGVRAEVTNTNSGRGGFVAELVGDPSGSATTTLYAVSGQAEIKAGNAQNYTTSPNPGITGVRGMAVHAGSGIVSAAATLFASTITSTGGGVITTAYGLYMQAQTAATNNWGVYQLGTTTPNMFAGPLTLGSTAGPIIKSGTGSPEAVETAPVGSVFLRTNGAPGSTVYAKTSGAGNTGWAAVA